MKTSEELSFVCFYFVKCRSKFDCLIFEMVFIKELNLKLNTQRDSIRAKLFTGLFVRIFYHYHYIFSLLFDSCLLGILYSYIRSHFTHFWLDNDVKRTSKRRRIFKLLTKMAFNFLNLSTLSQFFIVNFFFILPRARRRNRKRRSCPLPACDN